MIVINPFIAAPAALLVVVATYVWWSGRTKVDTRSKRLSDFALLWPIVLQGHRTKREKIFMVVGVVIAVALICWSFTLPKP
jgi:hypothetical protein